MVYGAYINGTCRAFRYFGRYQGYLETKTWRDFLHHVKDDDPVAPDAFDIHGLLQVADPSDPSTLPTRVKIGLLQTLYWLFLRLDNEGQQKLVLKYNEIVLSVHRNPLNGFRVLEIGVCVGNEYKVTFSYSAYDPADYSVFLKNVCGRPLPREPNEQVVPQLQSLRTPSEDEEGASRP